MNKTALSPGNYTSEPAKRMMLQRSWYNTEKEAPQK
jgi:hypothetical protein